MKKVAVVTGASRGLGYASAVALAQRGYRVIFAMRKPEAFQSKLAELIKRDLDVLVMSLDTSKSESIDAFFKKLQQEVGHCDVLVNNAGIFIDNEDGSHQDFLKTKRSTVEKTFATNTIGPMLLIQKFLPAMMAEDYGRIVNVSSGMGQLSEMSPAYAAYRMSKTALNALTALVAAQTKGTDVLVNSICPGWVRTDMGGPHASRTIDQGIKGIVWAATLPKDGPNGGFYRDSEKLAW